MLQSSLDSYLAVNTPRRPASGGPSVISDVRIPKGYLCSVTPVLNLSPVFIGTTPPWLSGEAKISDGNCRWISCMGGLVSSPTHGKPRPDPPSH